MCSFLSLRKPKKKSKDFRVYIHLYTSQQFPLFLGGFLFYIFYVCKLLKRPKRPHIKEFIYYLYDFDREGRESCRILTGVKMVIKCRRVTQNGTFYFICMKVLLESLNEGTLDVETTVYEGGFWSFFPLRSVTTEQYRDSCYFTSG